MASWLVTLLSCFMPSDGSCTVLEFTAPWCQPCKEMAPTLQRLANEGWEIRQVDTDRHPELVKRFRINNLPTLVIVADNSEVDRIVGVTRYDEVKKRLARAAARTGYQPPASELAMAPSSGAGQGMPSPSMEVKQAPQPIVRGQSPVHAVPRMISGAARMASEVARSPAGLAGQDAIARARDATVRIRVDEGNTTAHGTGTIVDVHGSQALILTCGHLFRDMNPQSQLSVDLFAGTPKERRVAAELVDYSIDDSDADVGLITIQLPVPIAPVEVLPRAQVLKPGQPVFSFGCDHGADPSLRESQITHVNRYLGAANVEISGAPAVGRSGGGLFDSRGRLIGVCNAANEPENEGIYAGPNVFYEQLAKLQLQHLFEGQPDSNLAASHLAAAAQGRVNEPQLQREQPSAQLDWPDQSMGSSPSISSPAPTSLPAASTAPVARQLIVIVKSADGQDKVVTIDQPTPELVSQIRSQSAVNW